MKTPDGRTAQENALWVLITLGGIVIFAYLLGALRQTFLCDDAFISFRYARHLVDGLGLVWNPGERVEGYSNFLWVLLIAAGARLGVTPELLAPLLGGVSGLGILIVLVRLGARDHGWRDPLIWLAPATLALNRSFLAWSTGGLETQFFSLLMLAGFAALLDERRAGYASVWRSPVLLALATLTRPEGLLAATVAGGALAFDLQRRRIGRPTFARWAGLYSIPVVVHVLWRHAYYGEWLPNTFHAKVSGLQWQSGLRYLAYFATSYQLHLLLVLAVLALVARRGFREDLFAILVGTYATYLAAIGGGFLEFRFVVPILPYLYWLMADGVRVLAEKARGSAWRRWREAAAGALALVLLVATAVSPRSWMHLPFGFESVAASRQFAEVRVAQGRFLAGLVQRGILPADLRVATGGVGALPYYTDWFVIDSHGLTDRFVAKLPVSYRRLAHQHNVTAGYLKRRRVAVALLSQVVVVRNAAVMPTVFATGRKWLASLNGSTTEPSEKLRPVCVEVEPGTHLFFATNLDASELSKQLGDFPPCDLPDLDAKLEWVAGGDPRR